MKKEVLLSLIILSLAFVKPVYGQKTRNDVPLFKFLQQNADSTLAFEYVNNWIQKPDIMILSKKADTVSVYRYEDNRKFDQSGAMPKNIRDSVYSKNRMNIFLTPITVNIYFNSIFLHTDSIHDFWNKANSMSPWQLLDDKMDNGEGCPITKKEKSNKQYIYDGGGITLYLITKKEIRPLYFYAPDYFEQKEMCRGNYNRQTILKIAELFSHYFRM
ncbi:hypothetical protein EZJ43_05795 [Pedobacter changchengzhani]|uniref:Uncharacterized protein n=1 Tax=Pedobacter changchengzhani TaxID=2529274 RepID=A0A4R5MM89_9SPHI|nr:hypothetical protein [Pedobacter changchengzhani]TDG36794.1 hypothetical protein EZJ43_05795 [Pedobacter changchengzhani]